MTAQSIFASILRMTLIVGRKLQLTFFSYHSVDMTKLAGSRKWEDRT